MPRDVGTGIYRYPDGTPGIPAQTIFSARYNTFLDDLANTLNTALPINMGGTGSTTAAGALVNLGGEVAMQVVTNYDSHDWKTGSFKSASGATGAPNGTDNFLGTVQVSDQNNIFVEARSHTTGIMYMRKKFGGAWGAWTADSGSAAFVQKAGDTMTGALTINTAWAPLVLNTPDTSTSPGVLWQLAGKTRFVIQSDENNWTLSKYNDAGTAGTGIPLMVERVTGNVKFPFGDVSVYGLGGNNNNGVIRFSTDSSKYLYWNGSGYTFNGGDLQCSGNFAATGGAVTANAGVVSYGGRVISTMGGSGTQPSVSCWSSSRGAAMGMFLDASNYLAIGGVDGSGNPTTNGARFDPTGNFWNNGWIVSAGEVRSTGGRIIASDIFQPSCSTHYPGQANSFGIFSTSDNRMGFHAGDVNGQPTFGLGYWDSSGNLSTTGAVSATICYSSSGGFRSTSSATFQHMLYVNPSWGDCYLYMNHIPGVKVYWNFALSGTNYEFDQAGTARKPGGGSWVDISDARIKTVLGNYDHGLDEVLQLNPVRFVYKGNDTQHVPAHIVDSPEGPEREEKLKEFAGIEPTVPYKNSTHYQMAVDQKEFIGFIAQDVETVMPEMVSQYPGFIDGKAVTDIRELDTNALLFALVNAVKTLAARIEALEAK